jgi:hypothetical protein
MIQLKLSVEEKEVLANTLHSYLSNLSYEIADTDSQDFRDGLKHERDVLNKILGMLEKDK